MACRRSFGPLAAVGAAAGTGNVTHEDTSVIIQYSGWVSDPLLRLETPDLPVMVPEREIIPGLEGLTG